MPEYRLTPAARQDLKGIWQYTRQTWGADQADRYVDDLTSTFETLTHSPLSAPACDSIRTGYRRRSVERHVVYFKIAPHGITVVRVLHERMDARQQL